MGQGVLFFFFFFLSPHPIHRPISIPCLVQAVSVVEEKLLVRVHRVDQRRVLLSHPQPRRHVLLEPNHATATTTTTTRRSSRSSRPELAQHVIAPDG